MQIIAEHGNRHVPSVCLTFIHTYIYFTHMQVFTEINYNGNTRTLFYLTTFIHSLFRMFYVVTSSVAIADIPLSLESGFVIFASVFGL
jgi:hypothetical protein